MRTRFAMMVAVALLAFASGCGSDSDDSEQSQLPNPAAVFCEEQGGTTSGPEPMCELPDGSVVDAWEYFRANAPQE